MAKCHLLTRSTRYILHNVRQPVISKAVYVQNKLQRNATRRRTYSQHGGPTSRPCDNVIFIDIHWLTWSMLTTAVINNVNNSISLAQATLPASLCGWVKAANVLEWLWPGPAVFRGTRIFTLRRGIRHLPRNLLLAVEKCGIARFLLHLYIIPGFSGSFLILPLAFLY